MLKVSVLDANTTVGEWDTFSEITSVVGRWLEYEISKTNVERVMVKNADIILLVHAGELDWRENCVDALRAHGIETQSSKRQRRPYIITGGAVDTAPLTALSIADALAIGEAYHFVRELLRLVAKGGVVEDIAAWVEEYPHAIEHTQIAGLQKDPQSPWLLSAAPPVLATPDEWVDWGDMPPVTSDDGVTRIMVSKGCHLRCAFCATTYRQTYRIHDDAGLVVKQLQDIRLEGGRVSLITNDAAALPYYQDVVQAGQLQFQSMTIKALRDPHILDTVKTSKMKIVRFGVEGLSERIRNGFGKPVSNDELFHILREMWAHKQSVHLFYIVGAPYETVEDWLAFEAQTNAWIRSGETHLTRVKMTAFNPQAPTPLAYFVPSAAYYERSKRFYSRKPFNQHFKFILPRAPHTRTKDFADTYALTKLQAIEIMRSADNTTIDLAPTVDHAKRAPWEMVDWHLSVERRWRLSRSYVKRVENYFQEGA